MAGKPGRPRKNPVADQPPLRAPEQVLTAIEREKQMAPVDFVTEATPVPRMQEPHPSDVEPSREASRQARSGTREGFGRQKRKPLGVPVQRLQADVPTGMTGRWCNDTPGASSVRTTSPDGPAISSVTPPRAGRSSRYDTWVPTCGFLGL